MTDDDYRLLVCLHTTLERRKFSWAIPESVAALGRLIDAEALARKLTPADWERPKIGASPPSKPEALKPYDLR